MATQCKRGAEQVAAPKAKRGRASKQVVPVDPVAKQCHAIAEALQSADLPLMVKEMLVAVMPNAFANDKDERHDYQEQMVQTIGNTLNGIEADIQKQLTEAETRLKTVESTEEELKQEQSLAQDNVKTQHDLLLEKKKALAQSAAHFREAKRSLVEARAAEHDGCKEGKKVVEDLEVLTLAMQQFDPLKKGSVEPAQSIVEIANLMNSLKGRLVLDETLSVALPDALATPLLNRSSFTTMVVHNFEDLLIGHIQDLKKRCEAEESAKQGFAAAVLAAERALESVAAQQMEAADVFTKETDELDTKTRMVNDKKKAVRDTRALIRNCQSSLAEVQIELDKFHQGPLDAFGKLQCRTKEAAPESLAVAVPEGKDAAAPESPAVAVPEGQETAATM